MPARTDAPADSLWPLTHLEPSVTVMAEREKPVLPPKIEACVQTCWDEALKMHPILYNGRVFCADYIRPDRISGHWSEFRRVFAQMRRPGLYGSFLLRPLAVVGRLRTADGTVIGQRAQHAVYLPGWWQGAPAGNVESRAGESRIDLSSQLVAECTEELGLSSSECTIGRCLVACEHPDTHIVDIGMDITTHLTFPELQERCAAKGNAEYATLMLLRQGDALPTPLVPTLRAMLDLT